MAVGAFVQGTANPTNTGAITLTGITLGDLLVVWGRFFGEVTSPTFIDSAGNVWHAGTGFQNGSSFCQAWWCFAATATTAGLSFTGAGSFPQIIITQWESDASLWSTGATPQSGSGSQTSTFTSAPLTVSVGDLVLGLWENETANGVNFSDVGGFTARTNAVGNVVLSSKIATGTTETPEIQADASGLNVGWMALSFTTAILAPTITSQPADQTVNAGSTATFSVTATSSGGSLTYQWKHTAGTISGATSASYTTPTLTTGDDGDHFWCTVSDDNGSTDTSHALLTVNAVAPTIYSQPGDQTVTEPATATFSVTAVTSGGTLDYQWHNDSGPVYGAISSSYTTGPTTRSADNGTHYWCTVTDDNGSVDTRHALLTVLGVGGGTRARIWMML